MPNRMKLDDLKVDSFVTVSGNQIGAGYATCDCSLPTGRICEFVCSDACPTDQQCASIGC